ncbi:siphovirus ReqiPepy6 Gp37-like family protein [Saccharothrix australiensis]|uniref:ReqiPepy6 Gp37-like protein n=1 Tax=Saccharothrix australiensis TaxID=2072 RepID=A0A495VM29_9PSEU|nr:siphovirus ReqiPepy6 Gp37-like family protein [Saccharothrix australiensis]RKT49365.1 ReqiPepy6 Gp37-like protein [Saccharothrix australiensis]
MSDEWKVYVRTPALRREAEVDDYAQLDTYTRHRDVGTWAMEIDGRSPNAGLLVRPGWGIEVVRNGATVFSGPMRRPERQVDETGNAVRITGWDDMVWLRHRLVHPEPTTPAPPYSTSDYDVRTGHCSAVLLYYVNRNAASGALSPRRVPGLQIAADPVAGTTVTGRGRWQQLLPFLQDLAIAGGDIGFRVRQDGAALVFEVFRPRDLSSRIKLSTELGTLARYEYAISQPAANFFVVGGSGEGTARTVREGQDAASIAAGWPRIERWVDRRDTSDTGVLDQEIRAQVLSEAGEVSLGITPVDLEHMTYLTDYGVGDTVSTVVDEITLTEVIREARVQLRPDGVTIAPSIGTPSSTHAHLLRAFRALHDLDGRLSKLERR